MAPTETFRFGSPDSSQEGAYQLMGEEKANFGGNLCFF